MAMEVRSLATASTGRLVAKAVCDRAENKETLSPRTKSIYLCTSQPWHDRWRVSQGSRPRPQMSGRATDNYSE